MTTLRRAIPPLLGLIASIVLFLISRDLDRFAQGGQLGPGFWPRLTLGGLGAACLAKAVAEWRGRRRPPADEREPGSEPSIARHTLAAAMALLLLYVLGAPLVGFALATAAFIGTFMWLAGGRSPAEIAVTAVVGTVSLLYVFVKLVYLPLPKGAGPFEGLTLMLYRALRIF